MMDAGSKPYKLETNETGKMNDEDVQALLSVQDNLHSTVRIIRNFIVAKFTIVKIIHRTKSHLFKDPPVYNLNVEFAKGVGDTLIDVRAIRDVHMKVPEAVRVGESVTLACVYDLESVALYSIKWYRYDVEFYRFVPKESPPSKVFPMPHINVDLSRSNSTEVTLTNVERETSGEYKCEVSADAPRFHTDIRSANLLVADIPEEGPVLRSDQQQKVAPGANIKANCTTPGSYPSMNVTWFINDSEIHSTKEIQIHDSIFHYDALPGKEIVRSTITIRATSDLFKNGKMKLRCLATMFALYSLSAENEIQEDAPQLALIMVPTTHAIEGVSNAKRNFKADLLVTVFLFFLHLHAWLRRTSYH